MDNFKDFLTEALKPSAMVPGSQSKEFITNKRADKLFKELDTSIEEYFNNSIEAYKLQHEVLDNNITSLEKSRLGKDYLKELKDEFSKIEKTLTFLNRKRYTFKKGKPAKEVINFVLNDIAQIDKHVENEINKLNKTTANAEKTVAAQDQTQKQQSPVVSTTTDTPPSYDYKAPGEVATPKKPEVSNGPYDYKVPGEIAGNATPAVSIPKSEISPEIPEVTPTEITPEKSPEPVPVETPTPVVEPEKSPEVSIPQAPVAPPVEQPAANKAEPSSLPQTKDFANISNDKEFQDEISKIIDGLKTLGESISPTILTEANISEILSPENIDKIKKSNLNPEQLKNLLNQIKTIGKKHGYNFPKGIIGGTASLVTKTEPVKEPLQPIAQTTTPEKTVDTPPVVEPPKAIEVPKPIETPKQIIQPAPKPKEILPPEPVNPEDDTDLKADTSVISDQQKEKLFNEPGFQGLERWYNQIDIENKSKKPNIQTINQLKNNIRIYLSNSKELQNKTPEQVKALVDEYKTLAGLNVANVENPIKKTASSSDIESILAKKRGQAAE